MSTQIPLRLGLQQRVLPSYRVPFFDALACACRDGLSIFAGQPRQQETIETSHKLQQALLFPARNRHLFSGLFYLCWQSGILDWLRSWQPQALVVEANPRYLRTRAAVVWMHARRYPVIAWGLGAPEGSGSFAGLRQAARRAFISQFDALLVYSRRGYEQYVATGFDPRRIFIAHNAAVPRPVQPPPERPLPADRPALLFVGRLQARKRVDLLLQACAALPPELQPRLWVVGDGPARAELESLARQVFPAAQFFGGVYSPELDALFQGADLFILPGTGGLAVQQAMSFGLPVMVAEGDGTQSDLVGPGNGWSIPPSNLASLTLALKEALADVPRLRRMGRESFRIVAEEVNLEQMVEVFGRAIDCAVSEVKKAEKSA
jgi:glycosyltransferase involved in cell wall biosynthesis